jgi:hypothetical protein
MPVHYNMGTLFLCRSPTCITHARTQAAEAAKAGLSLPWPLALLFSTFVAIAATGSIFEYIDRNPIFGVIQVATYKQA